MRVAASTRHETRPFSPTRRKPKSDTSDMPRVNPDILKWARTTAGMSLAEAANKIGICDADGVAAADRLKSLELGQEDPTHTVLHNMSKCYRRSSVVFYLSEAPRDGARGEDFRTQSKFITRKNTALTNALKREICLRQFLVRTAMEIAGEDKKLSFVNSMTPGQNAALVAYSIQDRLNFDQNIFRNSKNHYRAFSYFRNVVENIGISVMFFEKLGNWDTKLKTTFFRGFVLADDVAPFIVINANDSPGAWSFTLASGLAHIWIGKSGTSDYTIEHPVEAFSNDVASNLLLSSLDMKSVTIKKESSSSQIVKDLKKFAYDRNICSAAIGYKLLQLYQISDAQFQKVIDSHHQNNTNLKNKWSIIGDFGDFSQNSVLKFCIGHSIVRLVKRMIDSGNLPVTKAAKILGINSHNVREFLEN